MNKSKANKSNFLMLTSHARCDLYKNCFYTCLNFKDYYLKCQSPVSPAAAALRDGLQKGKKLL
jgi:hypothetical protein